MFLLLFTAVLSVGNPNTLPEPFGTIHGVVVNGTRGGEPISGADVLLRGSSDGALVPVAKSKADMYGNFVFEHVALEPTISYLPGSDRDGVHYPGKRLRLNSSNPTAHVTIVAFDAVQSPSPLVATRHDIDVHCEPGVMIIKETLLVTNGSKATYVGEPIGNRPAATLRLSIPENFNRITFDNEFYGRRFWIADRQPITGIPWPPGDGEMTFTYRVPLEGSSGQIRRPLDLPCSEVRVRVLGENSVQVSCNLPLVKKANDDLVFASVAKRLPAGYTIELQFGNLPFPWMQCARLGSIIVLVSLILVTVVLPRLRGRTASHV